jgi:allantoicase
MSSPTPQSAFASKVDLLSAELGGEALICSDDFFAPMHNLVKPGPAVFDPDAYTEHGKLMDGWESRRSRIPGHDWCILRLGAPGRICGLDIDTSYFLGNHPPFASLDGTVAPADATPEQLRDEATWTPLLPPTPLQRGSHNLAAVQDPRTWTHVRLHMHPDGGIARLRVYGDPTPATTGDELDLACLSSGGRALACSDMFFSPMNNLLLPQRAEHMGRGWETRRSRPPGHDWLILALGQPGVLSHVVLDTNHFKGNFPDRGCVEGLYWPDAPTPELIDHPDWAPVVPWTRLRAHEERRLEVVDPRPLTHLRVRIVPDGGVSRLRAWGTPTTARPADADPVLSWLNGLAPAAASEVLARCCGSRRWVDAMVAARPFTSRTHLHGAAGVIWWRLAPGDWREAFTHHPRIGANPEALRARFAPTATWASGEQAGVRAADEATLQALAEGNRAYEARYGHLFIVCATGLTATEMLHRLTDRMDHRPEAELRIAAGEQAKITSLRLDKLEVPT